MMSLMQETSQNHSVLGYMQRLPTKELFHLLRRYIESDSDSEFYIKEIISILENRFEECQK